MRWIALLVIGFLIVASGIGSVTAHENEDNTKIIVITLNFNKEVVTGKSVEVRYGHPPNHGHQKGNFTTTLRARDGTPLFEFDIWDPRCQFEDHEIMEDNETCDLTGSMWCTDNIDILLIIPYHHDIRTLDLTERKSGTLLISVNVSPAINSFNRRFPLDRDVIWNTQPVPDKQNVFLIAGSVLAGILMIILIHLVRKT